MCKKFDLVWALGLARNGFSCSTHRKAQRGLRFSTLLGNISWIPATKLFCVQNWTRNEHNGRATRYSAWCVCRCVDHRQSSLRHVCVAASGVFRDAEEHSFVGRKDIKPLSTFKFLIVVKHGQFSDANAWNSNIKWVIKLAHCFPNGLTLRRHCEL